jgi:hypothetical protein
MKTAVRALLIRLPAALQAALYKVRFAAQHPKLFPALRDYTYTDEHLKFVHILECMNYVRVAGATGSIPQVFFEFGCHSGRTFSAAVRAARFLKMEKAEFYAFDSFRGLPSTKAEEDGIFQAGSFATSRSDFLRIVKSQSGVRLEDDHVIEGFYAHSLTSQLQSRMPKAGAVHIDVDLYSSTVEVLEFIKPLIVVGTVLLFDDWYCFAPDARRGEMRAVKEFREANPSFAVREWKAYSTFGQSFFVTALP